MIESKILGSKLFRVNKHRRIFYSSYFLLIKKHLTPKTQKNSFVLTDSLCLFTQNSRIFFEKDNHYFKKKYTFIALKIVTHLFQDFFET